MRRFFWLNSDVTSFLKEIQIIEDLIVIITFLAIPEDYKKITIF